MKKIASIIFICVTLFSCSDDKDDNVPTDANIAINFTQNWDGANVTSSDFNDIKFTNANGEEMSVERLRYLISNIILENAQGEKTTISNYNLIDVGTDSGLTLDSPGTIPTETYNLSFTFGFNNEDNYQNYTDLNSASWNVPAMLGGGYHYMQLEGKFVNDLDVETGYAYHAIRAANNSVTPIVFQDTFIEVDLGEIIISNNATIEMKMDISQWFKSPNTWDLNILNNMLMPNFDAQVMMFQNGQNVFSLGEITQ